jgi:NAD(P)H-hydrate epimerase
LEIATRADAVAIGPGLGVHPETEQCVRGLLGALRLPAVVDADAIQALPSPPHPAGRIVTPHAGELARWIGAKIADVTHNRLEIAPDVAQQSGCVVVAKGAPTIVATPAGVVHVNTTGGASLATAGSGDVLTGMLAGLLARGLSPEDAARLGVYLHGRAGELAALKSSPASVIAGDLVSEIGPAISSLD